jgi:hypothetical protein
MYPADAIPMSWFATTGPGNSFPGMVGATTSFNVAVPWRG